MSTRGVVFVCSSLGGEALRCANAIKDLDDVALKICIADKDDLIETAKALPNLYRIVTAQETLLATVAAANEALGLDAMSSEVVARTLDKSKLKATLRQAGVRTPRDQIVNSEDDARRFVAQVAKRQRCADDVSNKH